MPVDETHDPALVSWVSGAEAGSDFPIQNLPLGIFSVDGGPRRAGVAIGSFILDLAEAESRFPDDWRADFAQPVLNAWLARSPDDHSEFRRQLSHMLSKEHHCDEIEPLLVGQSEATMHLPCLVGDYTDFYVGIHHATNVGRQFRPDNPLLPNYKYVPIG